MRPAPGEAHILIVDDEPANVLLLERILDQAGYPNHTATTDPRQVLAIHAQVDPDLILLDLAMPHLDGLAVMAQLRQVIPAGTYLPILVLTADITTQAKQQALSGGATDFLLKPFDPTEVLLRIGNLLQTRRLHLELRRHNQLLEDQLVHQALHDPLTGLANRALFGDRLEHALTRPMRPGATVAVLLIDLDDFKDLNDTLGHDAGDDLLTIIAARLQGHTRPGDTIARLGGDEFGLLLEDTNAAQAVRMAEVLLQALAWPVALRGRDLVPTASIGIAIAAGEDAETLLRNADTAMYAAKRQGKGRSTLFEPAMHTTVLKRVDLAADLSRAVQESQLHLCYQPEVHLRSGRIVGLEALLRWHHPTRGAVSPGEFIPIAEDSGLIVPIGRWVLQEACHQAKSWQQQWPTTPPLAIAVNLSARQLQHPAILDEVRAALAAADLDPHSLVLEITETAVMEQLHAAVAILTRLRKLGVRLALDDFGTGYSSLSYLQRLPVDILKIDRSFIGGVTGSAEQSALARAIVNLGHTLGLQTVAEGIETAEQLATLRELGCQLGQGYHLARPLGPAAVDVLLDRQHPGIHNLTAPTHQATS
jgi:diguanylate cyclase (GGDEF)-like protein